MNYSIYAESTPNPEVMKFVANRMLTAQSIEISDLKSAQGISLLEELIAFPFIKSIYISTNFISITKIETIAWEDVAMQIRVFILDHLNSEKNNIQKINIIKEKKVTLQEKKITMKKYSDKEKEIEKLLDQYIKPAVEGDGGAITLKYYKDNVVCVDLKGACSGCPSAASTLKVGIEALLKQKLNPNVEVIANEE